MPLTTKLDRKLNAAEESSDDLSYYEVSDRSSPSIIDTGEGDPIEDLESDDDNEDDDDEQEAPPEDDRVNQQLSKVSFGALAKAQDALSKQQSSSRKRKRGEDTSGGQEDKLQALRQRLQEIKAAKLAQAGPTNKKSTAKTSKAKKVVENDEASQDSDDDSDSDEAPRARSSKHAPMKQTSKRPVTRRRDVFEIKKSLARDPRFDNAVGARPDDHVLKNRYAFLDDYRESEMAELRSAIKKTKDEDDKETLKRKLMSMQSQKKAQESKDKRQEIIREHKKKEKELIKEGKQPFFLKKSEQKKLALIDRFQNMKAKERDKVIERRRKKASQRERRNMPAERRMA